MKADFELIAANLDVAPRSPAQTFHQALLAIYIMHCALHWTVENRACRAARSAPQSLPRKRSRRPPLSWSAKNDAMRF
jgi:hypothetical protein